MNTRTKRMWQQEAIPKILILTMVGLILTSQVSSAFALIAGVAIAILLENPWLQQSKKLSSKALSYSLVALGAGMNLYEVAQVGLQGFSYTLISISLTLILGYLIWRVSHSDYESSLLITVGTAICGGSAIAAVAPSIEAKSSSTTVALAVVFLLNSLALFLFPALGHFLRMDQHQFGLWAALAIHDTSSVVGATMLYGPKALEVGATVKMARALWIIPLTFVVSHVHQRRQTQSDTKQASAKKPWFILGFLLSAAIFTFGIPQWPELASIRDLVASVGRRGLVLSLFMIGLNLNLSSLRTVGVKPVALGIMLWILASTLSGIAVLERWIH